MNTTIHRRRPTRADFHHLTSQQLRDAQQKLNSGASPRHLAHVLGVSQVQLAEALTLWNDERIRRTARNVVAQVAKNLKVGPEVFDWTSTR